MRSFSEYEQPIRVLFTEIAFPLGGINYTWLMKLKALRSLIAEAESIFPTMSILVGEITSQLHGSAAYAWAMRDTLEEMRFTLGNIENHMREFDSVAFNGGMIADHQSSLRPTIQ